MPVYEYKCTNCGQMSEFIQKISDPPVSECELCNGKLKKLISHSTFHLKGSGWYVTDYSSKNSGYNSKSESSGGDKANDAAGPTKEAKGAAEGAKASDGNSEKGASSGVSNKGNAIE